MIHSCFDNNSNLFFAQYYIQFYFFSMRIIWINKIFVWWKSSSHAKYLKFIFHQISDHSYGPTSKKKKCRAIKYVLELFFFCIHESTSEKYNRILCFRIHFPKTKNLNSLSQHRERRVTTPLGNWTYGTLRYPIYFNLIN